MVLSGTGREILMSWGLSGKSRWRHALVGYIRTLAYSLPQSLALLPGFHEVSNAWPESSASWGLAIGLNPVRP